MQPTRRPRYRHLVSAIGLTALISAVGTMSFLTLPEHWTWAANDAPPAAVAQANDLSQAFRYASEKVLPSVVTIRSEREIATARLQQFDSQIPEELSPLLRRFFEEDLRRFETPRRLPRRQGMGSGVIIDSSGIILTNNHVVGDGAKVMVKLHDGREFQATEVLTDPKTDLAVVRIEGAGELPAARLGSSEALQIGDWVLAIGAPFGLDKTVTAGIISAKQRGVGIAEREDFLQTDAAINPGNSGGPLVNLNGEVVGINTAISTRGGGSDGIGFAIPVDTARWVSQQLIEKGRVERAFLGVGIQQVTPELSEQLGLPTARGALVTEVRQGSAAEKAGVQIGDVIVKFGGKPVATPAQVQNVVERAAINETHELVVNRNGKEITLDVTVQPMPESLASAGPTMPGNGGTSNAFGINVEDLTDEVASQLGLDGVRGVVITGVAPGSLADRVGLTEGTVISRVGSQEISSAAEFEEAVENADPEKGLLLLVRTSEGSRFVVLKG